MRTFAPACTVPSLICGHHLYEAFVGSFLRSIDRALVNAKILLCKRFDELCASSSRVRWYQPLSVRKCIRPATLRSFHTGKMFEECAWGDCL